MIATIQETRTNQPSVRFSDKPAVPTHRYVLPPAVRYRRPSKWTVVVAVILAIAVHAGAIISIEMQHQEPPLALGAAGEDVVEATIEFASPEPEPTPVPEDIPLVPEVQPTPAETPEFAEEKPVVEPKQPVRTRTVGPIRQPRVGGSGVAGTSSISSAKALAIHAPRPQYPYEARRDRITGSGVILVNVDRSSGLVTSASVSQSTGSSVLDNAATTAFKRWRFKPGSVTSVRIPVTFTMAGAQY